MKHLGDITKINGAEIEPVDCITAGSPCQDLSVAGKRAGLAGERSGLFMEQIRIIREMRENERQNGRTDQFVRPRYMVWENVPGALSSNGGDDFRAVLEETIRIVEKDADVPRPPAEGWHNSGVIVGRDWSVAWRIHNAQYWGIPQRRRRICVLADFNGLSAPGLLFGTEYRRTTERAEADEIVGDPTRGRAGQIQSVSDRLPRDPEPGKSEGKRTPGDVTGRVGETGKFNGCKSVTERMPILFDAYQHHGYRHAKTCGTLTAGQNESIRGDTPVITNVPFRSTSFGGYGLGVGTLRESGGDLRNGSDTLICECLKSRIAAADMRNGTENEITNGSLQSRASNIVNGNNTIRVEMNVRRLTPTECERLQGFPDGWTDIGYWTDSKGRARKTTDGARYKALGNSIALPFWFWLLRRISSEYERTGTLGSLFDGIGGFPLCWERCNGPGTARWASEIEEFPIAVTKKHFKEEGDK